MKLPNGYGSVVKLSGKRRKPYAVRISVFDDVNGVKVRRRKYLEYFSTQKEALAYLSDYNKGLAVTEHTNYSDLLTFKDLYDKWIEYRWGFKNHPGENTKRSYHAAFNYFFSIHDRKIATLRASDLQDCLTAARDKSESTITNMGIVVRGMWKYALSNEYLDRDITVGLVYEFNSPASPKHTRFTDSEINTLWKSLGKVPNVDIVLIYIYTGMRLVELLGIRRENIHLDERYMIGGVKTAAGKNRVIPIHESIVPLIKDRLSVPGDYLLLSGRGTHYTTSSFRSVQWSAIMEALNMNHSPHDTRYTFAALASNNNLDELCVKIILGHSVSNASGTAFKVGGSGDVTQNVYTEKTIDQLVAEINKIPVKNL